MLHKNQSKKKLPKFLIYSIFDRHIKHYRKVLNSLFIMLLMTLAIFVKDNIYVLYYSCLRTIMEKNYTSTLAEYNKKTKQASHRGFNHTCNSGVDLE